MTHMLWHLCISIWRLSYWMFGLTPTPTPSVGGFWTRLVFFPALAVLCPLYWVIIAGPVSLVVAMSIGLFLPMKASALLNLIALIGVVGGWVMLFTMSRKSDRHTDSGMPQVYHRLLWFWRGLDSLAKKYNKALETPLQLDNL